MWLIVANADLAGLMVANVFGFFWYWTSVASVLTLSVYIYSMSSQSSSEPLHIPSPISPCVLGIPRHPHLPLYHSVLLQYHGTRQRRIDPGTSDDALICLSLYLCLPLSLHHPHNPYIYPAPSPQLWMSKVCWHKNAARLGSIAWQWRSNCQ